MIPIHFHAVYLPNQHEFNVRVKLGGNPPRTLFEKMSVAKFLRLARQQDKPITVAGMPFEFIGDDGQGERQVRAYLKQVADAYVQLKYKRGETPKAGPDET